jgi:hypothetical protein
VSVDSWEVVFDKTERGKEYGTREWELDDRTFEYELDCPPPQSSSTVRFLA